MSIGTEFRRWLEGTPEGRQAAAKMKALDGNTAERQAQADRIESAERERLALEAARPALQADCEACRKVLEAAALAMQGAEGRRRESDSRHGALGVTKSDARKRLLASSPPELRGLRDRCVRLLAAGENRAEVVAALRAAIAELEEAALIPEVDLGAVAAVAERLRGVGLQAAP